MAEIGPPTPEVDPQEAIAEVLVALGNDEPTADQLRFLTAEADRVEGGLIVHAIDARDRNEHKIPDGVRIHNIDFPDTRLERPKTTVFYLEHTFNYVDSATGKSKRLDDTLAKTLLEFSTYARALRAERFGAGATGVTKRSPSGRLPDSGRVHIDEDSYAKIKAFVETCPRMSDGYLEQKGLTKREASAVFAALQRDGTIDSTYTEGEGYLVSSRRRAETPPPTRARRQSLFTRAVNGLFSSLEEEPEKEPVVRAPAPYRSESTLLVDTTSLQPITPVTINSKESAPPAPKREDYILKERYWPKIVRYVAGQVSPTRHPKVGWPQVMQASAFASELGKMDKETAGKVVADIYLKLRMDGVLHPIYSKDQRGKTIIDSYKLLKSKDEILNLYGITEEEPAPPDKDTADTPNVPKDPNGYDYITNEDLDEVDTRYRDRFTNKNLERVARKIRDTIISRNPRDTSEYEDIKEETVNSILLEELGDDATDVVREIFLDAELKAAALIPKTARRRSKNSQ